MALTRIVIAASYCRIASRDEMHCLQTLVEDRLQAGVVLAQRSVIDVPHLIAAAKGIAQLPGDRVFDGEFEQHPTGFPVAKGDDPLLDQGRPGSLFDDGGAESVDVLGHRDGPWHAAG